MSETKQQAARSTVFPSDYRQTLRRRLVISLGTTLFITIVVTGASLYYSAALTQWQPWLLFGGSMLLGMAAAIWVTNRALQQPMPSGEEFGPAVPDTVSDDEDEPTVVLPEPHKPPEPEPPLAKLPALKIEFNELSPVRFEGIAIHNKVNILEADQAVATMFGYARSDLAGTTVLELLADDTRGVVLKNILQQYEKPYQTVGLRQDGTTFRLEIFSQAITYQGQPVRVMGFRQIAERDLVEGPSSVEDVTAELGSAVDTGTLKLKTTNEQLQNELGELRKTEAELTQRNRELTILQSAAVAITSSLDLRYVLDTVTQEMVKLLGIESCAISHWNRDDNTISRMAKFDSTGWWNPELLTDVRHLAQYPVTRGVLTEKIPEQMTVSQAYIDPAELDYMKEAKIKTRMILPMIYQNRSVGLVELEDSRIERTFSFQEISLVKLLANQAASAIENARLYHEIQQHVAELTTLNEISHAITSTLDLYEMLAIINEQISQLLGVAANSVALYDESRQEVWFVAASGEGADFIRGKRLPLDQGVVGWVIRHGEPVHLADVSTDSRYFDGFEPNTNFTTRSILCVPLQAKGRVIGAIEAMNKEDGPFTQEDLRLLRSLALQAAAAIENAQLFEQAHHEIAERQQAEAALQEERALLAQRVKERTAELSKANAELARAARLKDEFLANTSHELRTPLNVILGSIEILETGVFGEVNEKQLKYLHNVRESGSHLLSLINDILDLSKMEAGKLELEIGPVSVESVCQASLRLVKQLAHKKRLKVSQSIDNTIATLPADERRLKQVLVNLLSNAIKFTPEGGQIGLQVDADAVQKVVRFTVWDTGIGITPEDLVDLFKPFIQVDSSLSRQHEGTGLGLSLVSRLTELHGGGVSVESEVGSGSRFTVTLPCAEAAEVDGPDDAAEPDVVSRPTGPAGPASLSRQPRILLAEDNEDNINMILDYLQVHGYDVILARNGVEAIERAGEEKPDLILMDIQMPHLDGLEATRRLRADAGLAETPIIALTALTMPGDRERCLEAGANEYLSKPVSPTGLVKAIENFLSDKN